MTEESKTRTTNDFSLRNHREYAWEYFKVHAQQRMSLFNFFVVFSSLATTCLVATFQEKASAHTIGIGIGMLLMAISIIFWRIDKRVRFLIKHAENVLKWVEGTYTFDDGEDSPHVLKLFMCEERQTARERPATYSKCFEMAFLVFGLVGLSGTITSAVCLGWDLQHLFLRGG